MSELSIPVLPAMADVADLQRWAEHLMASRRPDQVIGDDYLLRWWVVPRNPFCNVYLHDIRRSDNDRALHDHPWANTSLVITGGYVEHTPDGTFTRRAGDTIARPATARHRLEIIPGTRAITLFVTGPKVREWGFWCGHGWVHCLDFVDPHDTGKVGRGCGEHDAPAPVSLPGTREPVPGNPGNA